jgi:hypothetical protein
MAQDELIAAAAMTVAGMIDSVRRDDREALAAHIADLLNVVTKLGRSEREIADAALTRTISRLP